MEKYAIILNDPKKGQKHYAVHCKCGHVGRNNYIEIVFAVRANNGREAAAKARRFARVKHNKKSAIIRCYEISHNQYNEIIEANRNDPYLKCRNIQEQRSIKGFDSRIVKEFNTLPFRKSKQERRMLIEYKLKKQKQFISSLNSINICDYMIEKGNQNYENIY